MNSRVILPVAVFGAFCVLAAIVVATSSPVEGRPTERQLRSVRVALVENRTVQLEVRSQGTVAPRTESELIPEVSGRVVWTSPKLVSGGYFEKGEALLRIDRTDYEANVTRSRAALARTRGELKHARQTLARQRNLKERNVVSRAALDDAERTSQVAEAGASEARVALEQAQRDLDRTEVPAPFDGRVREEHVDVGQFANRGQSYATLYATDFVEVRLPIADSQLAYLELPLWSRVPPAEDLLPEVTLSASFAGQLRTWVGRIVRTEGEIDSKSRLVNIVARVPNTQTQVQSPLPVGLFVQARITGRVATDVAAVPRQALLNDERVLVLDDENRLRFRAVEVLRIDGEQVLLRSGLKDGERVCISSIPAPVDGMSVLPVGAEAGEDGA
ncbi:MAG: efflux RND transporter periplasmic adaptor subunit [bacterium]|nr:efflux RND transporter periplasmic adaptor subunit [bacterium]